MIYIIPKPTDTHDDDSTGMVIHELSRMGEPYEILHLSSINPLNVTLKNQVIWVCGIRQDGFEFECIKSLSLYNRLINKPEAIVTCASKVSTSALLLREKIPTPATLFCTEIEKAATFIHEYGKVVYKPVYGFDGNGIVLIQSVDELPPPPWYLQQYIRNDRDYRVFVLDGKPVGAIVRQSDTLTHNIHQGGLGRAITIDETMSAMASKAASCVGVDYGGVDLIEDGDAYTVLEVNGTPNWHCMTTPIPRLLAEYLVTRSQER
jgi:tetrahydromethanopterin:alpha-L-glutamate ligase